MNTEKTVAQHQADEELFEKIRGEITRFDAKVQALEVEAEAVEEQLGGILADRLLGKRISSQTLSELETQKRENAVELGQSRSVLRELSDRLATMEDEKNARYAAIHMDAAAALAAKAIASQNALYEVIFQLADAYEVYATDARLLKAELVELKRWHNGPRNFELPRSPMYEIPAGYEVEQNWTGPRITLREHFENWLDMPRREAIEAERQQRARDASFKEMQEREERYQAAQGAPKWAIGDAWLAEFAQPVIGVGPRRG